MEDVTDRLVSSKRKQQKSDTIQFSSEEYVQIGEQLGQLTVSLDLKSQ